MPRSELLNDGWVFGPDDGVASDMRPVDLPHSAVDLPLNYFDEGAYQRPFLYRRRLTWRPEWQGQQVWLRFDGAMADAQVWLDGHPVVRHADGYTPFIAPLTDLLRPGADHTVTLRLDGSENPDIPPFGGRIDYLTYAGLYRDVWLEVASPVHLTAVKVDVPDPLPHPRRVRAGIDMAGLEPGADAVIQALILTTDGDPLAQRTIPATGPRVDLDWDGLEGLRLWSPDDPALFTLSLRLTCGGRTDRLDTRFGCRQVVFTPEGFRLNGQVVKLLGLNRHQSFPYTGYAQGRRSQERDADILRHDLGCNIVRSSHYPASPWFLDRCDEIGLMVFEEIPGWQHIGGEDWKAESVRNVERMIRRDWNHPSVVIWGTRINESRDDHDFYLRTSTTARALDPSRQTGGVRFITDSELLEDVYTMNDFVLGQEERDPARNHALPLRAPRLTTGRADAVPYLVTEFNGHMFPTKAGDPEQRMAEQAMRHLQVIDAAFGDPQISGCIGWCMADYNTHKDFGAGDRICHHGVLDMFRMPKPAAFAYASQRPPQSGIVMEPVTVWARGERNIGGVLPLLVLTNCDRVTLHLGGTVKTLGPDRARFPHLPHPPVIFDFADFAPDELTAWGGSWPDGRIIGMLDGVEVARRDFAAAPVPHRLEVRPDAPTLSAQGRDEVRVTLRGLDQTGNPLRFLAEPVGIAVGGAAGLLGPDQVVLAGGQAAFWLRAGAQPGPVAVTLTSARFGTVTLDLAVV